MGNTVILHIGFGHNGGMISDALNDSHIDETVFVSLPPDFKNLKDNPALTELEDSFKDNDVLCFKGARDYPLITMITVDLNEDVKHKDIMRLVDEIKRLYRQSLIIVAALIPDNDNRHKALSMCREIEKEERVNALFDFDFMRVQDIRSYSGKISTFARQINDFIEMTFACGYINIEQKMITDLLMKKFEPNHLVCLSSAGTDINEIQDLLLQQMSAYNQREVACLVDIVVGEKDLTIGEMFNIGELLLDSFACDYTWGVRRSNRLKGDERKINIFMNYG